MTCTYKDRLLQGYIDGELDTVHSLDVEDHLETCDACKAAYQSAMAQRSALSDASFLYKPSSSALSRLDRALDREAGPRKPHLRAVLSYAVAAVIVALAPFLWIHPNSGLESSIIDAHIRSLQPGHLEDVVSTDQHTVKPWFNGRLDYSPPVTDLAKVGFPLVGGRLDYIDGRPVSALVYHRAKHVINVFVWPTDQSAGEVTQEPTRNGYNVFHWQAKQMTWWAASDLNTAELRDFCDRLQGSR